MFRFRKGSFGKAVWSWKVRVFYTERIGKYEGTNWTRSADIFDGKYKKTFIYGQNRCWSRCIRAHNFIFIFQQDFIVSCLHSVIFLEIWNQCFLFLRTICLIKNITDFVYLLPIIIKSDINAIKFIQFDHLRFQNIVSAKFLKIIGKFHVYQTNM